MRPHRRQPTRLPSPWDSPGRNTGVGCHFLLQCMKVKSESEVAQSCLTLSDPIDCSLPGSSIHGIFQARVLGWVTIAFSGIYYECIFSHVQLFATPWTVARQAPLSMGFSKQEYWSGVSMSFSRGSSRPRDRTQVSRIAGRRFTLWATREALLSVRFQFLPPASIKNSFQMRLLSQASVMKGQVISPFLASSRQEPVKWKAWKQGLYIQITATAQREW